MIKNILNYPKNQALIYYIVKSSLIIFTFAFIFCLNILFTQTNTSNNLDCTETVSSFLIENNDINFEISNKDYYFTPNLSNLSCIGKIGEIEISSKSSNITIGSNPKFVYIFFTILSFYYLLLSFSTNILKVMRTWENYLLPFTIFFTFLSSYFYGIFKIDYYIVGLIVITTIETLLRKFKKLPYSDYSNKKLNSKLGYAIVIFGMFNLFEFMKIYSLYNKNSWQVLVLFFLISNKYTNREKTIIFLLGILSFYYSLQFLIISILAFLFINSSEVRNYYLEKIAILLLLPTYVLFRFEELSKHFTIDPDHFVWIFTAIRMEELNLGFLEATLESKGIFLYFLYFLANFLSTLFKISIWKILSFAYLLLCYFLFLYILKMNNKLYEKSTLNFAIAFLLFLDLTNDERIKFDARFLGSLFIFFGLYQILIHKKDFLGGVLLASSLFSLLTFGLPVAFLSIYLVIIKKRINILYGQLALLTIVLIHLITSGQIYQAYIMNFKIYFGSQYPYTKIPLIDIVNRNPFLYISIIAFLTLTFALWKVLKNKEIITVFLIWLLSEFIHLYLSGPRFEHYSILILVPSYLVLNLLFNEIDLIENLKTHLNVDVRLITLFILFCSFGILHSNYFPYHKNFPNEMYGDYISLSSSIFEINEDSVKSSYNLPDLRYHENYEYGIYVTYSPKVFINYFENYSILPSGSGWQIVWHRSNFINYEFFFSDKYFYDDLFNDYALENPKYAIIEEAEISRLRNSHILNFINENFYLISCEENVCLYEKNL
jgi:hypothetical protein